MSTRDFGMTKVSHIASRCVTNVHFKLHHYRFLLVLAAMRREAA
jgi:hypothetical protein